jgi:hypothetical protein
MLTKFELGEEAVRYMRQNLAHGNALSRRLLSLPLDAGDVFAYLPGNTNPEITRRLECGGVASGEVAAEIERELISFIANYLAGPGRPYAVFEDLSAKPSDACLSSSDALFFTHGLEVDYFLPAGQRTPDEIITAVRAVSSWVFNGFLSALPSVPDIRNRQEVGNEVIEVLAQNTKHILLGAYDREGYVIWTMRHS